MRLINQSKKKGRDILHEVYSQRTTSFVERRLPLRHQPAFQCQAPNNHSSHLCSHPPLLTKIHELVQYGVVQHITLVLMQHNVLKQYCVQRLYCYNCSQKLVGYYLLNQIMSSEFFKALFSKKTEICTKSLMTVYLNIYIICSNKNIVNQIFI